MLRVDREPLRRQAERALWDVFSSEAPPDVRREAALALAELGSSSNDVVEELVRALDDRQELVRRAAAIALGKSRQASAVEPLLRTLEQRPELWRETSAALVALDDPVAAERLCELGAGAQDNRVRRGAIRALGGLLRSGDEAPPDEALFGYVDAANVPHPLY